MQIQQESFQKNIQISIIQFSSLIKQSSSINQLPQNQQCIIINGFPYDQGTKRNGGRIGGAVASKVFRQMLHQHKIYINKENNIKIYDIGDIEHDQQLQKAHIQLKQKNQNILKRIGSKSLLFMIGGSNDQSYPNVKALMETYKNNKIAVINLDAHFDVRPLKDGKAHSGSPFRQMLQDQTFIKNQSIFVEFANKGNTCSNDHFQYLKQKNVKVYWMQKDIRLHQYNEKKQEVKTQAGSLFKKIIKQFEEKADYIFVSFDTDSINSSFMPGVSAPNTTGGLTNLESLQICQIAGRSKKVVLIDFSQFNPAVQFNMSSRLLVEMFYNISKQFSKRSH